MAKVMSFGQMEIFILEILGMVIDMAMAFILPKMEIITMENFIWEGSRGLAKGFIEREDIIMDFGKMGRRMGMGGT